MKVYSTTSQFSFKAISINKNFSNKLDTSLQKLSKDSLEKIYKMNIEGSNKKANDITNRLETITTEMIIRRKIEEEKPWYKKKKFKEIDKMEAEQKTAIIKEQEEILLACQKESILSREIQEKFIESIQTEDKIEAENIARIKANDNLNSLQAKLSDNTKGFTRIAGYQKEKNILNKYFINEIKKERSGEKTEIPNSVLFFGPTGNGKTTFARAFAAETGCKLEIGRSANFLEMLDNKLKKAEELFKTNKTRTILFIDEFDKIASENTIVIKKLKEILQNCSKRHHCTIFATTNHPLNITLPLTGENSVFSYIVSVDPPNTQNKTEILKYYLAERSDKSLDYDNLVKILEEQERLSNKRYNNTQLKEICLDISDKNFSENNLIALIKKTEPTIEKEALNKYLKEMQKLIVNEVNE